MLRKCLIVIGRPLHWFVRGRNLRKTGCMSDDWTRTYRSFHYHCGLADLTSNKSEPHHTSRQRMSCLDNPHHVSQPIVDLTFHLRQPCGSESRLHATHKPQACI
ncbi:uncharacterized protein LACBIDRAFT_305929 [Laccaria bicolor S238N-H82]|uniref:Predicted protein n=1 Tax=Laccaria bicolor (strain S238N-H82 / ATCC MYA-4686) TaxID=486041 RepID=B0CS98_LACBS|nr:uncharacterized protein LACBIDRAFT_305929 [Laccaria bicolor S238N-H82]EDR14809.1 predicted protein [Laccaria bicolor S238N-H82]|eukprot:XP_001875368.1 predicted protein [Laccaria bicolor S238N-H82]